MRTVLDGRPITFYLTRGITMQDSEYRIGDTVEIRLEGVVNYVNGDGTPDVTVKDAADLYAGDDGDDADVQNVPLRFVTLKRRALSAGDTLTLQGEYDDAPVGTVVDSFGDHQLVKVTGGWIDPAKPWDVFRCLTVPRRVLLVPEA